MKLKPVNDRSAAELVADLAARCWRAQYTSLLGEAQVDYMLAKFQSAAAITGQIERGRDYFVMVAEEDQPVGYLGYDFQPDHLFLSKLYVLPDQQGRGIGRWVVEQLASRHPGLEIRLTVNIHNLGAIAFYERIGFVKNGPIVADIGNGFVMDDWKMVRAARL